SPIASPFRMSCAEQYFQRTADRYNTQHAAADCWHLATALYLAPDPAELTFVKLDDAQRRVAKSLGFRL
ncbi:MAG: hypothetical protein AB1762_20505, partial [Gemmatimonadota bacterium]